MQVNATKVQVDATKVQVDATKVQVEASKVQVNASNVQVDATTLEPGREGKKFKASLAHRFYRLGDNLTSLKATVYTQI
ncbi:hypothetical protein GNF10_35960 [Nostoc sp. UCD121]|uniref:hypothetical protein n=1 Tax=unclassified Nostoc TaxID=2593658 RepID=UPI00162A7F6F|nr:MULTISPECIES: hypothetical protein [unclassified Nostoc]MBC1223914.1 hypothetical protein [Nostoc sp. UCD120]MBC1281175.1 hypothetical protein [Nostoc sp. UCD121]MBC1298598.1 hypothetical protein [Nostoc sp. UCD122]